MLSKVHSATCIGIEACEIDIEVDVSHGQLPNFNIVGLPDTAVKESKDRVRAAIKNNDFLTGSKHITVNLAPADIKKEGPSFDLPIALGILASTGHISPEKLENYIFLGELALDGSLRNIPGCLSIAHALSHLNKTLILPKESAQEASIETKTPVLWARDLKEVVEFLNGKIELKKAEANIELLISSNTETEFNFREVKGQHLVKRALEIAVSGFHHVLMIGPPGSGKSMLAKRISSIFPKLELDEVIQTIKIKSHNQKGINEYNLCSSLSRPFRSPHSSISQAGLIGGGSYPKPGEVSLAHHGVLFLDEFPEFRRDVIESLRSPLEDKKVTISRAKQQVSYPSNFMLICAMNPCPCGNLGSEIKECYCTINQINQYRGKISGPIMDRIDIHIDVPMVPYTQLSNKEESESSEDIQERIQRVRQIQSNRFGNNSFHCNSQIPDKLIRKFCPLTPEAEELLKDALTQLGMSARAYTKIIKLARTIADLENTELIDSSHISEAIQYRTLDRYQ